MRGVNGDVQRMWHNSDCASRQTRWTSPDIFRIRVEFGQTVAETAPHGPTCGGSTHLRGASTPPEGSVEGMWRGAFNLVQLAADLDRNGSNSARTRPPSLAGVDNIWSRWSISVHIWPALMEHARHLPEFDGHWREFGRPHFGGRTRAIVHRLRAKVCHISSSLASCGPNSTNLATFRSISSKLGRNRPNLGRIRPQIGQVSAKFRPNSAKLRRKPAKFDRSSSVQFWPNVPRSWAPSTNLGRNRQASTKSGRETSKLRPATAKESARFRPTLDHPGWWNDAHLWGLSRSRVSNMGAFDRRRGVRSAGFVPEEGREFGRCSVLPVPVLAAETMFEVPARSAESSGPQQ